MRIRRRRRLIRAARKSFELRRIRNNTSAIRPRDVLLVATMRNECVRLPFFLKYYRDHGVSHFLIIDNDSSDDTVSYLSDQPDVSLWSTQAGYKASHFGIDWVNWLCRRYAHGHWTVVVDPDEFLVYPFCDTRPIPALTSPIETPTASTLLRST